MITLVENFRAVFYAPFYAAEALGAYQAEGLQVAMKTSTAAENTLVSLNAGAGDVSWGGPLRIMNALDKDPSGGYVAFCEVVGRDPFYLVGRAPNAQFQLKDLLVAKTRMMKSVPEPKRSSISLSCQPFTDKFDHLGFGSFPLVPVGKNGANAGYYSATIDTRIRAFFLTKN